ncbi:hypothetical protein GPECTOR_41g723 [Gonium pectorale]|uniref:SMCHD1 ribosomal S5 domain-containing protein n=1 Tax=Gonium pectorale TaxID=33097 RepID=A0A150GAA7_GONPE|nr:hypothetical protein GPECTOR_41g723 [Gonium pectorale]|eukprot:KXZ46758.1 hypothetical protein GPECTOR_41g723 [Gonium pectorale]
MPEFVTVLLKDGLGGRRQTRLCTPFPDLKSLTEAVRQAFKPELDAQDFSLMSSSSRVIDSDVAARKLRAGDQLFVSTGGPGGSMAPASLPPGTAGRSKSLSRPPRPSSVAGPVSMPPASNATLQDSGYKPPAKERISFVPHPKTLTMAGDYEYFSARGHHPFAFALAELIDNALRATKGQGTGAGIAAAGSGAAAGGDADAAGAVSAAGAAGRGAPAMMASRDITISLVVNERGTAGLIRVQDNGRGMSPKELREWAVMNLSMEDRGLLPSGTQRAIEQAGGGRYLSGDLSFFGVGSKNAAFFMGSSVKLTTRQAGSAAVHELHIAGSELERRYKAGEAVYEEDLVHRQPGDESTLSKQEAAFAVTRSWLADEAASPASFTRVTISDLRPDVLALVRDSVSGTAVCRDLAHLYHYYLHGPAGNTGARAPGGAAGGARGDPAPGFLPGGEAVPNIVVEYLDGGQPAWQRRLMDVDDDLESRYVRAAKAKLEFALEVPGKGTVEGILWYFPYVNGAETIPRDQGAAAYGSGGAAAAGGGPLTQMLQERQTQLTLRDAAALATQLARAGRSGIGATQVGQLPEQVQNALFDMLEDGDLGVTENAAPGTVPIFETFWQGRLIPGSGVASLPFIDAVRSKLRLSASGKDSLPDEVFGRIRGALFFGPAWRVTRNKLTFRDPLQELLASATPSDRALDKRLRDWLRDCHTRLDRILHFKDPGDAMVRKELGEGLTGFKQVYDGSRTLSAGDIVRIATKPAALGRIKYFSVHQAGAAEGVYATGLVTFSGLPAFLHGPNHTSTLSLRRVEDVVTASAVEELAARERTKLPSALRLEPLHLSLGRRVDVAVGEVLPETSVTLHSSTGHKLTRTFLLEAHAREADGGEPANGEPGGATAAAAGPLPEGTGEVVLVVENKTPVDNAYKFSRITGGLNRAGTYFLEFTMLPELPPGADPAGGPGPVTVWSRTVLYATAGPPVRFELQGEARAVLATKSIALGEVLPPLQLACYDAQGNEVTPAAGAASGEAPVHVELVRPGVGGAGGGDAAGTRPPSQGLSEVQLEWQAVPKQEGLILEGLRVTGCRSGSAWGMRLFGGRGDGGGRMGRAQGSLEQSPRGGQDAPEGEEATAAADVDLELRVSLPGMPSQVLPLKLRPGAPASLRLFPDHPFVGEPGAGAANGDPAGGGPSTAATAGAQHSGGLVPVCSMNGEPLPEFRVQVLDAWGNTCRPAADLPATVELEGPVIHPSPVSYDVDARGVVTVRGVRIAAPDSSYVGRCQELSLSIRCTARGAGPRAALEAAEAVIAAAEAAAAAGSAGAAGGGVGFGWARLGLPVVVQPCTRPARAQLTYQGEPVEVGPSALGEETVALLRGVPAGCRLEGLSLELLDEGGRPAEPGFKGKLELSWAKTKKVTVTEPGAQLALPPLPVREQVADEPQCATVRFVGQGSLSGITLEVPLELFVVSGPPAAWCITLTEVDSEAGGGAQGGGGGSQKTENLGFVPCGALMCLEITAHDAHHNRCTSWGGPGPRPTPVVQPMRAQEDAPLLFNSEDWICGWEMSQAGDCEVYHVRLALGGSRGPVTLRVCDAQGPGGESLLAPDELPLELTPGRPTCLAFDGPQQLQCGTRGILGELRAVVTDDWGNQVEGPPPGGGGGGGRGGRGEGASALEVTLQSSAIAIDGSGNAAKVTVAGSNKTKVSKGCAVFRDVRVQAAAPGTYALLAGSASRKVALREARLSVEVVAHNVVRHVAVAPCSLPQEPLDTGSHVELQVEVTTEDSQPLPHDVATAGLCLRLKAPSAEAAAVARGDPSAAAAAAAGGGGASGSSAAACTVLLQPQPPDEGASPASRALWTFVSPGPLLVAGEYTVTAEYTELRPELTRELPKSEQSVRSVSHTLKLLPGAPVTATLEAPAAAAGGSGALMVTNGGDARGRALLSGAAAQLRDAHGNAVALDGVPVRWVLSWPTTAEGEGEGAGGEQDAQPGPAPQEALDAGAELPALEGGDGSSPAVLEVLTDSRGRAFFREVAIAEGTGRVGAGVAGGQGEAAAAQALHLELRLFAALQSGGGPATSGPDVWQACWSAPVVFSDDAARAASLQRLCARRQELVAKVSRREAAKGEADSALDAARQALQQAQSHVERLAAQAGSGLPAMPRSGAEARELLAQLREQHAQAASASQQRKSNQTARFGPSTSGVVMALNRCLAAPEGQGEVVGVMAQLATVDNPHLSALLAAAFSSTLQILVVRTYEGIKRLRAMLTANRNQLPSMLATTMAQGFSGDGGAGGRSAGELLASMRNASAEARELQAAACEGSDPPLAMLLPHTRTLLSISPDRARAAGASGPAADEWPPGCLGYAVNLVRPVIPGHRGSLFYSQLGRTLVFETLDQAAAYRTYVVQTLGTPSLGDIYTLDGGKLSGRGVVAGSGFRVVPLDDAAVRFGAAQSSQAARAKQLSQLGAHVEALADAMEAAEAAAAQEAEAAEAADAAARRLAAVAADTAAEVAALEAEIAKLAGEQPGAEGPAGGVGGGGRGGRQRGGRGGKRGRDRAADQEPAAEAEPQPDPAQEAAPEDAGEDRGRGQRGKRARGQGRMAAMQ